MPTIPYPNLHDMLEQFDDGSREIDEMIKREYSGRGMYGKTCFGVVLETHADVYRFFIAVTDAFSSDFAYDLVMNVQTDNLGRDVIVYFPGWTVCDVNTTDPNKSHETQDADRTASLCGLTDTDDVHDIDY